MAAECHWRSETHRRRSPAICRAHQGDSAFSDPSSLHYQICQRGKRIQTFSKCNTLTDVVFCQGAQRDFPSLRIPQRLAFGAGRPTGWNPGSTNTTNEGQQDRQTRNLYFGEYPEK
jgi:hypothetical protein